ncbi:MAG: response regulator, partial [Defluviitaleaceae bacterium]|nr:response regulator [Defluviitaleaceae bacterium]
MNVLLVDSDTENIKNFRTYLRGAYPQIKIVGNFTDPNKDIFAVINELAPSLIIADIKFFGGARYMHFMDIHNQFPDIRFIVYGTYNETDYMKRAREFGVIDFMYRPVKPADLSRCLDEALSQHKKAETEKKQTQIMTQNYHERL